MYITRLKNTIYNKFSAFWHTPCYTHFFYFSNFQEFVWQPSWILTFKKLLTPFDQVLYYWLPILRQHKPISNFWKQLIWKPLQAIIIAICTLNIKLCALFRIYGLYVFAQRALISKIYHTFSDIWRSYHSHWNLYVIYYSSRSSWTKLVSDFRECLECILICNQ